MFNQLKINKSLSQASTRLSQMKAFQKRLAPIEKYAVYFGKFEGGLTESYEYFDGSALFNVKKLTQALNKELEDLGTPFEVDEDLVLGQGLQARPYSIKSYFTSVTIRTIVHAIKNRCGGLENVVHLNIPSMSQEDRSEFISALNKHKDSKFWGKLVIVTMTNEARFTQLDFLADMNGFKAPFWPEETSYFNILEMSHEGHGEIKMSGQLCDTLFTADPEGTRSLILEKTKKLVEKKLEAFRKQEVSDAYLKDLYGDVGQLMAQLRPDFVQEQSASLYRSQVDNAVEGICNIVNDMNLPCEGDYGAVVPELSLLFCDKGLLHFGEAFIPGMEGKEVLIIKYPKMSNHEYMVVKCLTKNEYISRAAGVMSREAFDEFKNLVRNLKPGLTVLPAIAEIMEMLAGLDFDGDKTGQITEKEIIEKVKEFEAIIARIG